MKKNVFTKKAWRVTSAVGGCALAVLIGLTSWATSYKSLVCSAIGGSTSKAVDTEAGENVDTQYYKDNGQSLDDWIETESELTRKVQAEGSVLLRNKNNALPLKKGAKVSAFGYGTVESISTGMVRFGSPAGYTSFKEGMEENGKLKLNPSLYDFYKEKSTAKLAFNTLNEIDVDTLTASARSEYSEYSDCAIVVISRSGGEGGDLATGDFSGGNKFLALQDVERKMLEEASKNFDKVVVLLNSSYAMELGWLDEYDVDACLMIGAVGYRGFNAVSDILTGATNPSGKTVDTYAADSFSSPAMQNFGDFTYANSEEIVNKIGEGNNATKYVVEKEGIYVGYKYYETRYEDCVLNRGDANSSKGVYAGDGNWDYDSEVIYPFGYGLSYTSFDQKIADVKDRGDSYEITVSVTNTGDVAGKSVVEIYAQTPYTEFDKTNNIEVASVQLVGFDKTDILDAGKSEDVVVNVQKEDMAHYDSFVNKTYIMEAGTYYLTLASDAHDAVNNILKAKGKDVDGNGDGEHVYSFNQRNTDTETYSITDENVRITNQFDDSDLNYYQPGSTVYLSRKNWDSTFPTTVTTLSANDKMLKDLDAEGNYEAGSSDMSEYVLGADTEYTVAMMIGADFDDSHWNDVIDQMSIEDLVNLCARSGLAMVESIAYPACFMKDGSHRVADRTYLNDSRYAVIMPSAVIMASSYDRDLLYEIGQAFGEDNIRTGTVGHYAPGVNIHRTPYSGRNFEYYSEDGFMNGEMSVPVIKGMQEKGAIAYVKHLLGNEQETNRQGVSTFMSQQAVREIYLEGFKAAFVDAGTKGTMGGFNRIGCTWTGAHEGLMSEVLRNEFDWKGIADTDAVFGYNSYMGFKCGLMAGTTMWATSGEGVKNAVLDSVMKDAKLVGKLKEASHYLLYNVVNSLAFNGISATSKIVPVMPWWQIVLIAADAILGVVTLGSFVMVAIGAFKKKENEEV